MKRLAFLLIGCALSSLADGDGIAPFIKACHDADTACLKSSAQAAIPVLAAGVPALGISVMDPMIVDRVTASQAGLQMDFRNTVVKGLKNCKIEDLKRSGKRTQLELKCSVLMVGNYTLGGRLLLLPIEGNGLYKIAIHDILVKIVFNVKERVVDGVRYWSMDKWQHSADVLTRVRFQFQNLFNGQSELANPVHQFANENWKAIFHEVAPPIVKAIVTKITDETKKLFDNVPLKDLVLE